MGQNTFHVSLYVRDLEAATAHYRKILGIDPAKVREDYVKFEIADPPTILSLNLGGEPGTVGHLGIRYPGTGDVATELARVRGQGLQPDVQDGFTCCYAKADKFWCAPPTASRGRCTPSPRTSSGVPARSLERH